MHKFGRQQHEEEDDDDEQHDLSSKFVGLRLHAPAKGKAKMDDDDVIPFPSLKALGRTAGPGKSKKAPITNAMHPPSTAGARQLTIPGTWAASAGASQTHTTEATLSKIADNMERLTNLLSTIASNNNKTTKELSEYLVECTNNMQATQQSITNDLEVIADKLSNKHEDNTNDEDDTQININNAISLLDKQIADTVVIIMPSVLRSPGEYEHIEGLISSDSAADMIKRVQTVRVINSIIHLTRHSQEQEHEHDAQGPDEPPNDDESKKT